MVKTTNGISWRFARVVPLDEDLLHAATEELQSAIPDLIIAPVKDEDQARRAIDALWDASNNDGGDLEENRFRTEAMKGALRIFGQKGVVQVSGDQGSYEVPDHPQMSVIHLPDGLTLSRLEELEEGIVDTREIVIAVSDQHLSATVNTLLGIHGTWTLEQLAKESFVLPTSTMKQLQRLPSISIAVYPTISLF